MLLNYKQLNSEFYLKRQFPKAIVVSAKVTKEILGPLQFTVIQGSLIKGLFTKRGLGCRKQAIGSYPGPSDTVVSPHPDLQ